MTDSVNFPTLFVTLCGVCSIIAPIPLAGVTWQIFLMGIMVCGKLKRPKIKKMQKKKKKPHSTAP